MQRLVGRLIYLSHTRSKIVFPTSMVSQHMHNPQEKHLKVFNRILQCRKKTRSRGLILGKTLQKD